MVQVRRAGGGQSSSPGEPEDRTSFQEEVCLEGEWDLDRPQEIRKWSRLGPEMRDRKTVLGNS